METKNLETPVRLSSNFGFRRPMPHVLLPTNVKGAFYTPAPAPDFDPQTASPKEMAKNGMFWKRPEPGDDPAVLAAWENVFSQKWDPSKRIAPVLQPAKRSKKNRRGTGRSGFDTGQWAGVVVTGNWASVSGNWKIPAVSRPFEPAGPDGGWDSGSWLGIDGHFGSSDVLQAGVKQSVDSSGNPSYAAWFQWYTPNFLNTLSETSPLAPAIAAVGGNVFIAWKGDGNDNINIMGSPGNGSNFENKFTPGDNTSQAPVICNHNNQLFIAWIGSGNNNINIARADIDFTNNTITGFSAKTTLPDTSPCSPAIASVNGRLYISWKGDSNDNINVLYSTDNGNSWAFGDKLTSPETTPIAPGLAAHEGKLFITWKGDGNDNINIAQVTGNGSSSTGFSNKVVLGDSSTDRAALASWNGKLFIAWKGDGNDFLNLMYSSDGGGSFTGKYISDQTSPFGPCLAVNNDSLYVGWRGDSNDNLDLSFVGFEAGIITGISSPDYQEATLISNFPVHAGDTMYCSVQYINNRTAGYIYFANQTTGNHFPITLIPPPGASFAGNCVEWIMEENVEITDGKAQNASLPKFTPVVFNNAVGCSADGKTVANPVNGTITEIRYNNDDITHTTFGESLVTIDFEG